MKTKLKTLIKKYDKKLVILNNAYNTLKLNKADDRELAKIMGRQEATTEARVELLLLLNHLK